MKEIILFRGMKIIMWKWAFFNRLPLTLPDQQTSGDGNKLTYDLFLKVFPYSISRKDGSFNMYG
jgi:hypothetical protein